MTFANDYSAAYAIPGMKRAPEVDEIIQATCRHFDITEADLKKRTRKREYVYHRQVCIYLIMTRTKTTCTALGEYFGLDHSTILYSRDLLRAELTIKKDIICKHDVNNIINMI